MFVITNGYGGVMKTNLDLYKVFYYVAKNKSITQAANELMVSQPAVSKSIKTLERDLDTVLFHRTNDGVTLNHAGEVLYRKIKQAMELIISAEQDIEGLNNMESGIINIGAGNTIMQRFLMPYIQQFHEKYPNITVIVHTVVTDELLKMAQLGLVDIVFTHFPYQIPDHFHVTKIKTLHDIFVVSPASPYAGKTIRKSSLSTLPLVLLPFDASNRKNFNQFCSKSNIIVHPLMEIGNDLIIEDCAKSGLGVGLVVREYVESQLESGELVEVQTSFKLGEKDLICAVESTHINNIMVKKFIELLK